MAAGFLVGLALSRPITGRNLEASDIVRRCSQAVPLSIVLLGVGAWSAQHASQRLTGEGLYARTMHWFVPREIIAVDRWRDLRMTRKAGKGDDNSYASALDAEVVLFWRDAVARLDDVELEPTSPSYNNFQFARNVANGRLRAIERTVRGLRLHDGAMSAQAMKDMRSVDEMIDAKIAGDKQRP
jgi:hypothetical protein